MFQKSTPPPSHVGDLSGSFSVVVVVRRKVTIKFLSQPHRVIQHKGGHPHFKFWASLATFCVTFFAGKVLHPCNKAENAEPRAAVEGLNFLFVAHVVTVFSPVFRRCAPLFNNAWLQWGHRKRKSSECERSLSPGWSPRLFSCRFTWNILMPHIWAAAQKNWFTVDFIGQRFLALLWQIPMRAEANRTSALGLQHRKQNFWTFEKCSISPTLMKRPQNLPGVSQHRGWSECAASEDTKTGKMEGRARQLASLWFYLVMLCVI